MRSAVGMTIDPPPSTALLAWEDFQWMYHHELFSLPVNITDATVRFQSFGYLEIDYSINVILRGTDDQSVAVSWIYADRPSSITMTDFYTGDYTVTIDLQLATGWNRAVLQTDDIAKVITLKTESEPAGTAWILD